MWEATALSSVVAPTETSASVPVASSVVSPLNNVSPILSLTADAPPLEENSAVPVVTPAVLVDDEDEDGIFEDASDNDSQSAPLDPRIHF